MSQSWNLNFARRIVRCGLENWARHKRVGIHEGLENEQKGCVKRKLVCIEREREDLDFL